MLLTTMLERRGRPESVRSASGAPAVGRTIDLPGRGTTFVREVAGPASAPTLILLHGWSATADLNWFPYLASLGRHFRVVAMDHRGHGRGVRADASFRLEDCADDVAALADALGIDRAVVVGYSMGGAIAQLVWRRHRALVDGLVFCSTAAAFHSTARLRLLFRAAAGASIVGATGPISVVAQSAFGALGRWNGRNGGAAWGAEEMSRHDWGSLVEAGDQIGRHDARSWVSAIDVPTTLIASMSDEVVPVTRQIELARSIPDATLRRLPGGHHCCVLDADRFGPVLLAACREVAGRSRRRVVMPDSLAS